MATIRPFAALRPIPELASRVCELPYDVMSSSEAREIARGNPLSFLRISKPEIDLPDDTDPYSPQVYARGAANLQSLRDQGALVTEPKPAFYLYRQVMGAHSQTGLVAVASVEEYLAGIVRRHELTRPDKEDDRVRHVETLNAQTGPAFLTYKADPAIDTLVQQRTAVAPEIDFTAPDGIRHSAWGVRSAEDIRFLEQAFSKIPILYIADGHHRSAAAGRVFQSRKGAGQSAWFLSVIFPHSQMRILPYNRALKDLNGHTPESLLQALDKVLLPGTEGKATPDRRHEICLFLGGRWRSFHFRPVYASTNDPMERLDVTLLQKYILDPIFGITDPRRSERISFVGGIRGTGELERIVGSGEYACAFSMHPTGIEELMAIADLGGIMPPKSTWFEPKLRDGMFSHLLG